MPLKKIAKQLLFISRMPKLPKQYYAPIRKFYPWVMFSGTWVVFIAGFGLYIFIGTCCQAKLVLTSFLANPCAIIKNQFLPNQFFSESLCHNKKTILARLNKF